MAQMYVVEARDTGGEIEPAQDKQPPFPVASERQLFDYFNEHQDKFTAYQGEPGHWAMVKAWFSKQGWPVRPKTW